MALPRSRWIRWPLYFFALLLALPVTLFLVLVIYNHFDDPVSSTAQAWLDYPTPQATPGKNGFINLLALNSQVKDPLAAAQTWLEQAHRESGQDFLASLEKNETRYDQQLKPAPVPEQIVCNENCLDTLLTNRQSVEQQLRQYAVGLAQFDQMLNQPEFAEDLPATAAFGTMLTTLPRLDTLYRARIAYALEDGHAEKAYADWQRRQRFLQRMQQGSTSFVSLMLSTRALMNGNLQIVDLLRHHPESLAQAQHIALPALNPGLSANQALARVVVYDTHGAYDLLPAMTWSATWHEWRTAQPEDRSLALVSIFTQATMKRNATFNLVQQLHESHLAQNHLTLDGLSFSTRENPCAAYPHMLLTIDNPGGKNLACMGNDAGNDALGDYARRLDIAASIEKAVQQALSQPQQTPEAYAKLAQDLAALDQQYRKTN